MQTPTNSQTSPPSAQCPTVTVPTHQWQGLHHQLHTLKQQNMYLRQQLSKMSKPSLIKNRSLVYQYPGLYSREESNGDTPDKSRQEWKREMRKWLLGLQVGGVRPKEKEEMDLAEEQYEQVEEVQSKKINLFASPQKDQIEQVVSPYKIRSPLKIKQPSTQQKEPQSQPQQSQPQSTHPQSPSSLKLLQSICLYGPSVPDLQKLTNLNLYTLPNRLLYINSKDPQKFAKYCTYEPQFFPVEGVPTRRLREDQVREFCDQAIFKKEERRSDYELALFLADQADSELLAADNQVLQRVNGVKRLACFFVQFKDFDCVQVDASQQKGNNKSLQAVSPTFPQPQQNLSPTSANKQKQRRYSTQTTMKKIYTKSKYTLCIFTYFPFINVMQQILSSLMSELKIRRVERKAKQSSAELESLSIRYFIRELETICKDLDGQVRGIGMGIGEEVVLKVGHFRILFNFMEAKINDLLFGGWVFDIIRKFNKQLLYDIFTNIMAQQSICFVCTTPKLLTQVMFFFMSVLPNPFQYPHPCISKVMSYQLLDSPFVAVMGLNESSHWVDQNASKYERKIFVDLNGDQVRVRGKKFRVIKSDRLKKVLSGVYRKLQASSPLPQFFKRKNSITRPTSHQQNQLIYSMLKSLQCYYSQQIFSHLPNPQIIEAIKSASSEPNYNAKMLQAIKQIKKYIIESRKQKERDYFVESLVDQQVFYMYVSALYGLE